MTGIGFLTFLLCLMNLQLRIECNVSDINGICPWSCEPIKSCKTVYKHLVAAKIARDNNQQDKVEEIIRIVRGYVCDEKAENVCCPKLLGKIINSATNSTSDVYAENLDTFFWRHEDCFPWLSVKEENKHFEATNVIDD